MKSGPWALATAALLTAACTPGYAKPRVNAAATSQSTVEKPDRSGECITEKEVVRAQRAWSDGIINIGKVYTAGGDYTQAAAEHIDRFYGYDLSMVLFKPTLAAEKQFRSTFDSALSYFVSGNPSFPEDKGFAIKPWTKVRWENAGIINNSCNMAVAMGNYYFTPADGSPDTKVEYTFAYVRDSAGNLKIVVHDSSVPFKPAA